VPFRRYLPTRTTISLMKKTWAKSLRLSRPLSARFVSQSTSLFFCLGGGIDHDLSTARFPNVLKHNLQLVSKTSQMSADLANGRRPLCLSSGASSFWPCFPQSMHSPGNQSGKYSLSFCHRIPYQRFLFLFLVYRSRTIIGTPLTIFSHVTSQVAPANRMAVKYAPSITRWLFISCLVSSFSLLDAGLG
jgi:hypothetical protein